MDHPVFQHLDRYCDLIPSLPVIESETVQLGRGPLALQSLQILGRNLFLMRLDIAPLLSGYVVPESGWLGFMTPLRWEGDYIFNGTAAVPGDMFMTSDPGGYATVSKARSTFMIAVRRELFAALLAASSGCAVDDIDMSDQKLHGGRRALEFCRGFFNRSIGLSEQNLPRAANRTLTAAAENRLLEELVAFLTDYLIEPAGRSHLCLDPLKTVRRAECVFEQDPGGIHTLAELCAQAGVGKSRLSECFSEVYGISPARHLRQRKLTQVRSHLMDAINPPVSVKDVALFHGFRNNGRFAASYRHCFGELPSDTLANALAKTGRHSGADRNKT